MRTLRGEIKSAGSTGTAVGRVLPEDITGGRTSESKLLEKLKED